MSQPHVVVLDHTGQLGGAELTLVRLLDAVGDRAQVDIVLFEDGPLAGKLRKAGRPVHIVSLASDVNTRSRTTSLSSGGVRTGAALAAFLPRLIRQVRALRPDVVHTTSLKADLVGLLVAAVLRRPLVWHLHDRLADDYLPPRTAWLMRSLAKRVQVVVANSAATAATVDRSDVVVAHPGLAPDQVRDEPRPRPQGPPVIGMLGRISPTKDQLTFVRAAARIAPARPDVSFRIIGNAAFGAADYAQQVANEITALGLVDRVTLMGFVDDPVGVLDGLSLLVHCAAVPEPFGQVITEAMARGVPVIATSGGGVDEIMAPMEGGAAVGWCVPPSDVSGLVGAINEALARPDVAERRGRAGWERARARYSIDRAAESVVGVWQRLANPQMR